MKWEAAKNCKILVYTDHSLAINDHWDDKLREEYVKAIIKYAEIFGELPPPNPSLELCIELEWLGDNDYGDLFFIKSYRVGFETESNSYKIHAEIQFIKP